MMTKEQTRRNARFELIHHGGDYWKLLINGEEYEIGEVEGYVIQELLRRIKDNANTQC